MWESIEDPNVQCYICGHNVEWFNEECRCPKCAQTDIEIDREMDSELAKNIKWEYK